MNEASLLEISGIRAARLFVTNLNNRAKLPNLAGFAYASIEIVCRLFSHELLPVLTQHDGESFPNRIR